MESQKLKIREWVNMNKMNKWMFARNPEAVFIFEQNLELGWRPYKSLPSSTYVEWLNLSENPSPHYSS